MKIKVIQKIWNSLWANKKTLFYVIFSISLFFNGLCIYNNYFKPQEIGNLGDSITIPRGTIERILSIKPKVEFKEKIVYKEVKNPSTGSQKIGDVHKDLYTLENAIPKLEIDPINVIQTTKGISVSKKVDGILDYGYMRHYLTVDLKTKIIKQTHPDIRIGYTNIWEEKKIVNDIQLGWYPIHFFDIVDLGLGLGTKACTLSLSTTIYGNITTMCGIAFTYESGWKERAFIGIGLEIF
jgi:hypothetical protein